MISRKERQPWEVDGGTSCTPISNSTILLTTTHFHDPMRSLPLEGLEARVRALPLSPTVAVSALRLLTLATPNKAPTHMGA